MNHAAHCDPDAWDAGAVEDAEVVVNIHEDGTAGGHVSALAFLRRMMGAAAAGSGGAASAGLLGS